MAKEPEKPNAEPAGDAVEKAASPKSYRLPILIGLAALVLLEMIVLWLLISSAKPVVNPNIGLNPAEGAGGYEVPNGLPPDIAKRDPVVEKPISDKPFKVSQTKTDSDTTSTFSAKIYAKVRKKDETAFDKRYLECQFEVSDAVMTVLQGSTTADFQQVGSITIKAKTKKAINEVLGTPYVQDILCGEVSFSQQ